MTNLAEQQAHDEREQALRHRTQYIAALEVWFERRPFRCLYCAGNTWFFLGWEAIAADDNEIRLADKFDSTRVNLGHTLYTLGRIRCETCYAVTTYDLGAITDRVSRPDVYGDTFP